MVHFFTFFHKKSQKKSTFLTGFPDPRKWAKIQAFAGGPAGPHFFTFFHYFLTILTNHNNQNFIETFL